MARQARAVIDLAAIKHNYRLAKAQAPAARAAAIIKADAYGHGAVQVAKALADEVPAFGVAAIEEAIELREAGITQPILLLEGFFEASELDQIESYGFWSALHTDEQLLALESRLSDPAATLTLNIWVKVDSGMHRLGFAPERTAEVVERLRRLKGVRDIVLMTHFACSDEPERPVTREQITCFERVASGLDLPVSLSNSAGVMAWPDAHGQWLRPGIMLYGANPFAGSQEVADQLQPAMTLTSQIIAVRDVSAGEAVGYGCSYVCDQVRRIGTVAMGYGDGYPRHARSGTPVIVHGQRTSLAGRVSMDMLTIDLTDIPQAKVGDKVELWGKQLPVSEVATWCDTIPYTLLTCLTRRVKREYVNA
ncbi:alanine racemase [Nitrincola sp. MINF-07-Sa-05]|uniref:alanine racemase n=1 Tax=Nitrincola salilacus TaxID=3400273 RepID=UPI003917EF5A